MRGSAPVMFGAALLVLGVGTVAHAQDPVGPAATSAPPLTAAPDAATPAPAPAPTTATPTTPPPAVASEPPPAAAPAPPSDVPVQMMRDPFRPDGPATRLTPATSSPTTAPTTTTTTTVVITDRVISQPPPAPPPPRERFFVGGYGGFGGRIGPTSGRLSVFSNIRGGLLLGKRLSLGGSLVQMTKRLGAPIQGTSGATYQIGLAYGGVQIGIVAIRRGRFELGIDTLLGVGMACIYERERGRNGNCRESVKLFVAEPGAFMHFNLTNWMRIGFSGGYRFVGRPKWPSGADFRLAAPYFGANLDFGWFRRKDT